MIFNELIVTLFPLLYETGQSMVVYEDYATGNVYRFL